MPFPFQQRLEQLQLAELERASPGLREARRGLLGGLDAHEDLRHGASQIELLLAHRLCSLEELRAASLAAPAASERWGAYRVVRELGRGAAGVVYHAALRGQPVALKLLQGAGPQGLERFQREAQILSRLEHPGVVRLIDAGSWEGVPYLATELQPRGSLEHADLQLQPGAALRFVLEICEALKAAHAAGIVHRDLKPSNVLLRGDGRPCLVDFGLAKDASADPLTRSRATLGSPAWVAPEQLGQARSVDARADLFGVGALLWFLLTGDPPFPATSLSELLRAHLRGPAPLPREVPLTPAARPLVEGLLQRCLAGRRALRPSGAGALAEELRHCIEAQQS